ncbi:MAG TPA: TIM44-like domain-containing protein [Burkholderiales bacterium]
MRKWLLVLSAFLIGAAVIATDADARRLGGGRSVGAQRNVTAPPASTPAKPAQQQAAPQQSGQAAQPAQQPSRWGMLGGILGGLALGGLLGYLFGGNGLLGLLVVAALAIGVIALVSAAVRRRSAAPMQLAGMASRTMAAPPPSEPVAGGSSVSASASTIPAGFDTAGFLRAAKTNFIKLQLANDGGRLDEIREFTTREMFDELRTDLHGGEQTDVVALNADLLELATERDKHWASVRFSGLMRETPGTDPVGFEEVWNLVKPTDGSSGWLLAGIQQMH